MKKFPWRKMSVEEIGASVCGHLEKAGISVVLSGGGCVSIYSDNQYQSRDLDFVMGDYSLKELDPLMLELGFQRTQSHRHYENPECPYFVEFPPAPLTVGDEFVTKTALIKNKYGRLRLLRPVDSVKDRLAAFYHWKDRQSLEQAFMICVTKKIDMKELAKWSKAEGAAEQYQNFQKMLATRQKQKA
ncbi:MAG: hypothetical protein HY877_07905 [Deltaproteobacteria bacterium]|nr:hypothetical protein [Deltaproteobacteria bacterium]